MFIYICLFLGSFVILPPLWFTILILVDTIISDDKYLDSYEKILNTVIVNYNKMSLMLKPKLQIASYNCIYYFSLAQIKFNIYLQPYIHQLFENVLTYIGYNEEPHFTPYITVSFEKNGLPIETNILKQGVADILETDILETDILEPDDYDLFTLSLHDYEPKDDVYVSKHKCSNKKSLIHSVDFVESSIKFLNVVLKCNGNEYEIKLKDNEDNFYIIGTIIDSAFFKSYLRSKRHIENVDYENFKYILHLLDHNVNAVELDETNAILIKEDNYEIITLTNENNGNNVNKSEVLSDDFEDEFDKLE
jgi:hypothetical protein